MCYLCEQDDELFDYACCEECGSAICFDAPAEGVAANVDGTAKAMLGLETVPRLQQAKRWQHGLFCLACFNQIVAESN